MLRYQSFNDKNCQVYQVRIDQEHAVIENLNHVSYPLIKATQKGIQGYMELCNINFISKREKTMLICSVNNDDKYAINV